MSYLDVLENGDKEYDEYVASGFQSRYEAALKECKQQRIPFSTCRSCFYFKDECTIFYSLRRNGDNYECKQFVDRELTLELRLQQDIMNKDW